MESINIVNQHYIDNTYSSPSTQNKCVIAKGDSGATSHYFQLQDAEVLTNVTNTSGSPVRQPDDINLSPTGIGVVPLSKKLSQLAKTAMILLNLKSSSLLSMGQLCNDGCKVILAKQDLAVVKDNHIILRGIQNKSDKLWDIPIKKHIPVETKNEIDTTSSIAKEIC